MNNNVTSTSLSNVPYWYDYSKRPYQFSFIVSKSGSSDYLRSNALSAFLNKCGTSTKPPEGWNYAIKSLKSK